MPDYDPYPDAETAGYRYFGSGLKLPGGAYVRAGETVALPDHVAAHIRDFLEPLASGDVGEDADDDDVGHETYSREDLEAMEYGDLQRLASEGDHPDVDGRSSMDDIIAAYAAEE